MEKCRFRCGGGTNLEVLTRIAILEQELWDLKQSVASDATYGLTKVTSAADVTEESGIALSAVQNNASISGTIANKVENLRTTVFSNNVMKTYANVPFDFDNPNVSPGIYRIHSVPDGQVLNPPPGANANWGNVLVIRALEWDTVVMVLFTLGNDGIYFRSGVVSAWTSFPWQKISTSIL